MDMGNGIEKGDEDALGQLMESLVVVLRRPWL